MLRPGDPHWRDWHGRDPLPRTVDRHLSAIYTKLGVATRTAAAAFAIEHGLR